jgi:hypothetical protein
LFFLVAGESVLSKADVFGVFAKKDKTSYGDKQLLAGALAVILI